MSFFDYQGNKLSVEGSFSAGITNIFDYTQNTSTSIEQSHSIAYPNASGYYWGGTPSIDGDFLSYLIQVTPGEKLYVQNARHNASNEAYAVFYNANGEEFASGNTGHYSTGDNPFTVPAQAKYIRVPCSSDTVDTVMVLRGGITSDLSSFIAYGKSTNADLTVAIDGKQVGYGNLLFNAIPHRWYGKKVNCLGDSLTAMGAVWQSELKKLLGLNTIRNYGSSGTCITSLRDETAPDTNYRYRATSMDSDVDLIIVMTSINDNGSQLGEWNWTNKTGTLSTDTDKTVNNVATIAGATNELISILRTNFSSAEIVFFGHPHMNWGEWSFNACAKEKEICGYNAIPYFDACRESGIFGATGTASHFYTDGTHLTKAGNIKLAEYMAGCLRTL